MPQRQPWKQIPTRYRTTGPKYREPVWSQRRYEAGTQPNGYIDYIDPDGFINVVYFDYERTLVREDRDSFVDSWTDLFGGQWLLQRQENHWDLLCRLIAERDKKDANKS